jgi:hypothetical protein
MGGSSLPGRRGDAFAGKGPFGPFRFDYLPAQAHSLHLQQRHSEHLQSTHLQQAQVLFSTLAAFMTFSWIRRDAVEQRLSLDPVGRSTARIPRRNN